MNIFERIQASPEGGTVSLTGGELPVAGYYVGGMVSPLIIDDGALGADAEWNIGMFVNYLIEQVGADYLGWWTDEETDKVWIDGTSWHADYDEAERVCRERNEIAFFDIERDREFRPVTLKGE